MQFSARPIYENIFYVLCDPDMASAIFAGIILSTCEKDRTPGAYKYHFHARKKSDLFSSAKSQ